MPIPRLPHRTRAWRIGRPAHLVLLAGALSCAQAQAPGDVRIALVIGNAAYPAPAALANPANDAQAMGDTLRRLGFAVTELRDGNRQQMQEAIAKVSEGLKGRQGIGMLYYAGHGLQVDWRNYMVPIDAKLASAADAPRAAVDVSQVIEAFRTAGTRMNILVLDACRDNPFGPQAGGKGLAPLDAPPGTFLAYATAPGNVALDGDAAAGNSLYTAALVKELQQPVARIEDVFKRVRLQVRQKTGGKQIPWESTSLEEDFHFHNGKLLPPPKPDNRAKEQAFNQQKADWDRIKAQPTADDLYAFLQKHPQGSFSELAQATLEALQKPQVVPLVAPLAVAAAPGASASAPAPTPPAPAGKAQVAFMERYRDGDRYELVVRDGLTGLEQTRDTVEIRYRNPREFDGVALGGKFPINRAVVGGFVAEDAGGTYDPPWSVVPGTEFKVGNKYSGRSMVTRPNGSRQWIDIESRIVAREKIQSPTLGELDTYRVELTMQLQDGQQNRVTFWFEPDWGYAVRQRVEIRRSGAPDIRLREMVSRSRKG